jgi:N-acetylmuramoyl-L-alanine amidase
MDSALHRFGIRPGGLSGSRRPCGRALVRVALVAAALLVQLVLIASPTLAQLPSEPAVVGLRFGESGPRTRVVLDLDRAVGYQARVQTEPDRLVIELDRAQWRVGSSAGPTRGLARTHRFEPGTAGQPRFEVDMAGPFRIVGSIMLPPSKDSEHYRLVVDMVADGAPARTETANATSSRSSTASPPIPPSRPTQLAALPADPAPVGQSAGALPVVVLDPGHGGVDPGAIGVDGTYEKDLVLEMAKELRRLIERSGRYRVALTRDTDEFIPLRDRIARGRELGGQIFISIHADSHGFADQRGASVYTLSEKASDTEAAQLASHANKADILTGADLSQHDAVVATILIDLAQRDTNNKSIAFADIVADELAQVTSMVHKHRRFAGFAVLKSPDIPSVLLELGYLSNPVDARNLAQPDYRAKLGQAIVRSLDRYFVAPRS